MNDSLDIYVNHILETVSGITEYLDAIIVRITPDVLIRYYRLFYNKG
ncbi:MAG: hypothetical protein ACYC27_12380 [Armatimonadota bacterium]